MALLSILAQKSFVPHLKQARWDKTFLGGDTQHIRLYGRNSEIGSSPLKKRWQFHPHTDMSQHIVFATAKTHLTIGDFHKETL